MGIPGSGKEATVYSAQLLRINQPIHAPRCQGIESTLSQAVCAFGLRLTRYRGLAKTGLQHAATAAAIDLGRIADWFGGRPIAPTRTSRFAALVV